VMLSNSMIASFPASAEPNTNAMSMRVLQQFSSSLLSAEYPSTSSETPNLRALRRKTDLSFNVLKNLEENASGSLTGETASLTGRKKGKAATNIRNLDPLPFDSMGIAVPNTDAEVRDVYLKVLSQLRDILKVRSFVIDGLGIELNGPRITSPSSGSQPCHRFSNPRT
jgi:hypothetical protein